MKPHSGAAQHAGQRPCARMNSQPGASRRQQRGQHNSAGAKGAHEELPFGADVPQPHAEGEVQARPTSISGVALTSVSENTPRLPKEARRCGRRPPRDRRRPAPSIDRADQQRDQHGTPSDSSTRDTSAAAASRRGSITMR